MTKDEAIEAGELAEALQQCDESLEVLRGKVGAYPLTRLSLAVFDGDDDGWTGIGATVRVRPWLLVTTLTTLRGVIEQRLAALGVDMDPAHG